jgi:hypothetical protein
VRKFLLANAVNYRTCAMNKTCHPSQYMFAFRPLQQSLDNVVHEWFVLVADVLDMGKVPLRLLQFSSIFLIILEARIDLFQLIRWP